MFHGTLIASASGQNKAESKKSSAKVALHKIAPNLYEDLFADEAPPVDESLPGQEAKATPKQKALTNMEVPCGELGGVGADYRLSFGG